MLARALQMARGWEISAHPLKSSQARFQETKVISKDFDRNFGTERRLKSFATQNFLNQSNSRKASALRKAEGERAILPLAVMGLKFFFERSSGFPFL